MSIRTITVGLYWGCQIELHTCLTKCSLPNRHLLHIGLYRNKLPPKFLILLPCYDTTPNLIRVLKEFWQFHDSASAKLHRGSSDPFASRVCWLCFFRNWKNRETEEKVLSRRLFLYRCRFHPRDTGNPPGLSRTAATGQNGPLPFGQM